MSTDRRMIQTSEGRSYDASQNRYIILLIIGFLLLGGLVILSLTSGNYKTSLQDIMQTFINSDSNQQVYNVVIFSRIPRLLAAMIIGAALSVSGLVFQDIFVNHMASPDILGVSSGAGFGASMAIFLGFGYVYVWLFSFIGGILSVCITVLVSSFFRQDAGNSITLILSGIIIGGLMNSAIGLLKFLSNDAQLSSITYWLLGGLYNTNYSQLKIAVPIIAVGILFLYLLRWKIILLRNGTMDARVHGVNAQRIKFVAISLATLITAMSVSVGGNIGWIGLAVPNMMKVVLKDDNKHIMPLVILYGMAFTVLSDLFARTISMSEIPIGIITGIMGSIIFVIVLLVRRIYYE